MTFEPPEHDPTPLECYENMPPQDDNVVDFAIDVPVPLNNPQGFFYGAIIQ